LFLKKLMQSRKVLEPDRLRVYDNTTKKKSCWRLERVDRKSMSSSELLVIVAAFSFLNLSLGLNSKRPAVLVVRSDLDDVLRKFYPKPSKTFMNHDPPKETRTSKSLI